MEFLRRYFFKKKLWYENTVNLKSIYGLMIFFPFFPFFFFWFACCFLLFRLLNFLFQYFTSIENLPDTKNSVKNNRLKIKNNKFDFYKVLHNTQMSRCDAKILIFSVTLLLNGPKCENNFLWMFSEIVTSKDIYQEKVWNEVM